MATCNKLDFDSLKPIFKKFSSTSVDESSALKVFQKEGKYFIVKLVISISKPLKLTLIGNPNVNERQENNINNQALKDLTDIRPDIVEEFKGIFSSLPNNWNKGTYMFELLYDQKKKLVTFIDVLEVPSANLRNVIYGKRLVILQELQILKKEKMHNIDILSSNSDETKFLLGKHLNDDYDNDGDDEYEFEEKLPAKKRKNSIAKTYWIRDLCDTLDSRIIYTYKQITKGENVAKYVIVGRGVREEKKKHTVRKTAYKDIKEVPETLMKVIQEFINEDSVTRDDYLKNVKGKGNLVQVAFVNRIKSSERFQSKLQQYERGEIIQETDIYLVAGRKQQQSELQIFGYIRKNTLDKRNLAPAGIGDAPTTTLPPNYLSWAKPEDEFKVFKGISYYNGIFPATCVIPERYTGSTISLSCRKTYCFIAASEYENESDTMTYFAVSKVPGIYKLYGNKNRKRSLTEYSNSELVEQVKKRIKRVSKQNWVCTTQNLLQHVNVIDSFLSQANPEHKVEEEKVPDEKNARQDTTRKRSNSVSTTSSESSTSGESCNNTVSVSDECDSSST